MSANTAAQMVKFMAEIDSLRSRLAEVEKEREVWDSIWSKKCERLEAELLAAKAVVEAARRIKESPQINGMLIEDLEICVEAYDAALGRKES